MSMMTPGEVRELENWANRTGPWTPIPKPEAVRAALDEIERLKEAGRHFDDLTAQRIKDLEARLAKVVEAARRYRECPIDSSDRPESWLRLDALLAATQPEEEK